MTIPSTFAGGYQRAKPATSLRTSQVVSNAGTRAAPVGIPFGSKSNLRGTSFAAGSARPGRRPSSGRG